VVKLTRRCTKRPLDPPRRPRKQSAGDTWDVTLADGTKSKAALVAGR
jgi:hypothetical protein